MDINSPTHQYRTDNDCSSSLDTQNLSYCNASGFNMNQLKTCLCEFYQNQDIWKPSSGFCSYPNWNGMLTIGNKEDELENSNDTISNTSFSEKLFSPRKSAEGLSDGEERQNSDPDAEFGNKHSTSIAPKLGSAMKGSREKLGILCPRNLSVTWASDVYDPVPTSVSHVLSDQIQHGNYGKRNGKNKQNSSSKSPRGSKSKDKKQARKKKMKPL